MIEAGIEFQISPGQQEKQELGFVPRRSDPVFYNPNQALNRDLSLLVLLSWSENNYPSNSIVEAFSGSGIRALRYLIQGPRIKNITINDISEQAIQLTKRNFEQNNKYFVNNDVKIIFSLKNSRMLFKQAALQLNRFDIIDIDPFGTPQPFIRPALETLSAPGLIAVTATDMPVITGLYPNKAYKLYQIAGFKVKNRSWCHEIGLRMFIAYLQREGLAMNKILTPIISFYQDHYIRVFLRRTRGGGFDRIYNSHGFILDCPICSARQVFYWSEYQKKDINCQHCTKPAILFGPLFLGPLHESSFIETMCTQREIHSNKFDRKKRLERIVELFKEDLRTDQVWFYDVDWIAQRFKTTLPSPKLIVTELRKKGFKASLTHFKGKGIKTNAPLEIKLPQILGELMGLRKNKKNENNQTTEDFTEKSL